MFPMLKSMAWDIIAMLILSGILTLVLRSTGPGPNTKFTPGKVCQNNVEFFAAMDSTIEDFHIFMCKVPSVAKGYIKPLFLDLSIDVRRMMQAVSYREPSDSSLCLHNDTEVYLGTGYHKVEATEFDRVVCRNHELMSHALRVAMSINCHLADEAWVDTLLCIGSQDDKHTTTEVRATFEPESNSTLASHHIRSVSSVVVPTRRFSLGASSFLSLSPATFDKVVCANPDLLAYLQSTVPSFNLKNALIVKPIRVFVLKNLLLGYWMLWTLDCLKALLGADRSLMDKLVAVVMLFLMYH